MFKQESDQIEKRKKKEQEKLRKRQKEAFNLLLVCVLQTGRNSKTKGKKRVDVLLNRAAKKQFTLWKITKTKK